MKKAIVFLVFLLPMISIGQGQKNFIDQNYIELSGSSQLELTPDEIYLKIKISNNNKMLKASVEEQEKLMIKTLEENNIKLEDNFSVKDLISTYTYYFLKRTDISQTKHYELKVSTAAELSTVFKSLEKIGISNIEINKVDHSDIEKYKLETRIEAIKMAKLKAEKYVEAIGQELGKAIHIQEFEGHQYPMNGNANAIMVRGMGSNSNYSKAEQLDIEFSDIVITAKVHVKFQLQ